MAPSDFAKANIPELVAQLTTDEAIQLCAGVGFWHTHAIPRLGVPAIKVSDGPNGIRGNHFLMGTPAKCLPASTALGSTWDPALVYQVGLKLLAPEAKLRAASVILAPTCNIQRNPLGGRSFESFSEDSYLSGLITAAYINGVQAGGIGATVKHFVGNDKENDRMAYDSIMSQRALREVYLMPFMLAEKLAKPWAYMTAYNRLNGTHMSENPEILQKILRDEWKSEAMVMSDWFGVYSVDLSIKAGLDLEMPGVNKWRSLDLVNRSIGSRKLTQRVIKERAKKVLELVQKCAIGAPDILDGDGIERTLESDEDKELMRNVAAQSIVLLKNDNGLLPLNAAKLKKVAIIGGNAKAKILSGGGSAALRSSYFVSPYQGIVDALSSNPAVEVTYSEGARAYLTSPSLDDDLFTEDGLPGWTGSWHAHENDDSMSALPDPFKTERMDETRMFISTSSPKGITKRWTLKLRGHLLPREKDTPFEFGLLSAGRAKLFIDGDLLIDNWTRQRRGDAFFGCGSEEEYGTFNLKAGVTHQILVEFVNVRGPADGDEDEPVMDSNPGVRLGGAEVRDSDELLSEAVALAKEADLVIAVVGLNADWETEGNDRTTLALPGRTDELIEKVVAANPNTVVVTESGSSILMPWVNKVQALVHSWYLGNATGSAIADVLFGNVNPGGKLSLTFPNAEEHIPSFGHFHSENGQVRYAEDLFVGYKHFHHRNIKPLFAFGHGLSYTTFDLSDLQVSKPVVSASDVELTVSLQVTNTGSIAGSEVAQVYVTLPKTSVLTHPPLQLKGFAKVRLEPGKSEVVNITLDKYAVSYWEERFSTWVVEKGEYGLRVGPSSDQLALQASFTLDRGLEWRGL
ncbi:Glycoside hydrolase family 3 protein [Mycena indigotica]|uniref:beta-glucosidase n=1 Tax=Mycena indigotica TaxID=2126181 RepID=A0A8H6SH11_9AGAR|nr:Glycoside hydrolase family 3 protein [Mycena indigotica]KAF7299413.1 Glycoside hydrolase family 3 protein [Mycena indigotica]